MKGSALLLRGLSNLVIERNLFAHNGGSRTGFEKKNSPYFKYLARGNSTITMTYNNESCATNELRYFESCQSQWETIDMPPTLGAIYIDNCNDKDHCYLPVTTDYVDSDLLTSEEKKTQITDFLDLTTFK